MFPEYIEGAYPPPGLTVQEKKVMDALVTAHNEYCQLVPQHPSETNDWIFHLHGMQRMIAFRSFQRANPDDFPIHEIPKRPINNNYENHGER